ncbi:Glycoside Hydrolase Family 5 protein [Trametes cinnabarina]|uniref:glucan 1,3-beta-glucosidase n=1 Tax=Pycnoporus cinnabarinus TaxID=5643 RepID=A0A060S8Y1_PYCCI|nr:Glycoside Hydrolase Family 5 protein [Trametes cinnabarina]
MRLMLAVGALAASFLPSAIAAIPDKIYGVNLGGWLVLEPWMLPAEWTAMGGQTGCCGDGCIGDEFSLVKAYPKTADQLFNKHWSTWFTQDHVNQLRAAGINTVRIPVILDHHALPGVQTPGQSFTGHCTSDVEFYTEYNFHRALVWTAVMTALSHLDPSFSSVFAIEAVNEPIMNAQQTPGYGDFQKNFVEVIRAVELILGIPVPGLSLDVKVSTSNFTSALSATVSASKLFNKEVKSALAEAVPILVELGFELALSAIFNFNMAASPLSKTRSPLVSNFMDINWQYNDPPNPADAAIGPQGYDNHLYYNFGGVADPNPDAYLTSICNLQRVQNDAALGNSPLWFGEWGLPTQFNATDDFLYKWADAQKLAYSKGKGWIVSTFAMPIPPNMTSTHLVLAKFWNFMVEKSEQAGDLARQWSYLEGLRLGYLTTDPSKVHDPNVCAPYVTATSS